jgi:ribosomal protein S18 acetylase RimI-like enzyme
MIPTLLFPRRRSRTLVLNLSQAQKRVSATGQSPRDLAAASRLGDNRARDLAPPHVDIRPAILADAAGIRDLTRAAYAKWIALWREPLPMQADYERAVAEHTIDVLVVEGALAGLIETILRLDHLWIENVAVAPEQQGRGFGRLLLDHAERRAVQAGRPEIRLMTNQAFAANLELYAKRGYAIDRTEPFRGGTTVHMSKRTEPLDARANPAAGAGSTA